MDPMPKQSEHAEAFEPKPNCQTKKSLYRTYSIHSFLMSELTTKITSWQWTSPWQNTECRCKEQASYGPESFATTRQDAKGTTRVKTSILGSSEKSTNTRNSPKCNSHYISLEEWSWLGLEPKNHILGPHDPRKPPNSLVEGMTAAAPRLRAEVAGLDAAQDGDKGTWVLLLRVWNDWFPRQHRSE